jgi:cytochrome P450
VGTRVFGSSEAGIATLDHETHRMRRGAVGKYFSKEGIRRAEPIIHGALERFFKRLDEFRRSGQPLTISLVYMAFSSDIITEYCFAAPYNYLDHPDFNAQFFEMSVSVLGIGPLARRLPWLMPLMDMIPPSIVTKMDPGMGLFVQFREVFFANHLTSYSNI